MSEPKPKLSGAEEVVTEEETFFDSKLFRWISLFLYLSGISGMGVCISLYYLFFFDSTMPEIYLRFPITVPEESNK